MAGVNSTNLVDIINKQDYKWYSSWKPKNTNHKFVFKSNNARTWSADTDEAAKLPDEKVPTCTASAIDLIDCNR